MTPETRGAIDAADEVFHGLDDPIAQRWIAERHPRATSLLEHYAPGRDRDESYQAMVEAILASVDAGRSVCALFYGHPGVFTWPAHEAVRRARRAGHDARMLPAVSSEDCLFADLGVDPGDNGCQSYEATDFLLRRRTVDPSAALLLWQIGGLGESAFPPTTTPERIGVLVEYLSTWYPRDHEVTAYVASPYPFVPPVISRCALGELTAMPVPVAATLYVPPAETREPDPTMAARLGLRPTTS